MLSDREAQELEDEIVAAFVFGGFTPIPNIETGEDNERCAVGALREINPRLTASVRCSTLVGIAHGFNAAFPNGESRTWATDRDPYAPWLQGVAIGRRVAARVLAPVPVETVPERDLAAVE